MTDKSNSDQLDAHLANPGDRGPFIETASGKSFYPLDPRPEDFDISDISTALSNICRYNGHVSTYYSVAEHCVLMAEYMLFNNESGEVALQALLHDAAEAYIGDLVRPLKAVMPEFVVIENSIMRVLCRKLGINYPMDPKIKEADTRILMTERTCLMPDTGNDWGFPEGMEPLPVSIHGWAPERADHHFIRTYRMLCKTIEVSDK